MDKAAYRESKTPWEEFRLCQLRGLELLPPPGNPAKFPEWAPPMLFVCASCTRLPLEPLEPPDCRGVCPIKCGTCNRRKQLSSAAHLPSISSALCTRLSLLPA